MHLSTDRTTRSPIFFHKKFLHVGAVFSEGAQAETRIRLHDSDWWRSCTNLRLKSCDDNVRAYIYCSDKGVSVVIYINVKNFKKFHIYKAYDICKKYI